MEKISRQGIALQKFTSAHFVSAVQQGCENLEF
jgi:hypothetical protein